MPLYSVPGLYISIHALREEGDIIPEECGIIVYISIHALREEGDSLLISSSSIAFAFLSTPSARRATCWNGLKMTPPTFLSTPSARRATMSFRMLSCA